MNQVILGIMNLWSVDEIWIDKNAYHREDILSTLNTWNWMGRTTTKNERFVINEYCSYWSLFN